MSFGMTSGKTNPITKCSVRVVSELNGPIIEQPASGCAVCCTRIASRRSMSAHDTVIQRSIGNNITAKFQRLAWPDERLSPWSLCPGGRSVGVGGHPRWWARARARVTERHRTVVTDGVNWDCHWTRTGHTRCSQPPDAEPRPTVSAASALAAATHAAWRLWRLLQAPVLTLLLERWRRTPQ